jgi:signal transduction histidine kinase
VEKLFAHEDRDSCYLLLRDAAGSTGHQTRELRANTADGGKIWVAVEVVSLAPAVSQPDGFRMVLTDISARKRAEEALRLLNEQLETRIAERTRKLEQTVGALQKANEELDKRTRQIRTLTGELLLVEQRERRQLAKVLHDNLQQALVSAKFRIAALDRAGGASDEIGEIQQLLDDCIVISRSLTVELTPPIQHQDSLPSALEWLAKWLASHYDFEVGLAIEEGIPPVSEDMQVLLFESVRELLFNAVKHAGVDSATVALRRNSDGVLQVTVSDIGKGFESGRIAETVARGSGLGLFRIRERLESFDGRMEIEAAPGQGSRITLHVPLAAAIEQQGGDSHSPQEAS